jgi:hypothetical protein
VLSGVFLGIDINVSVVYFHESSPFLCYSAFEEVVPSNLVLLFDALMQVQVAVVYYRFPVSV